MPFRDPSYHRCPRCEDVALNESRSFGVHRFRCRSCFGAWLSSVEMQRQFQAHALSEEGRVFRSVSGGSLRCPHADCNRKMRTLLVGDGIELDFCAAHGFWFDCGELSAALIGAKEQPKPPANESSEGDEDLRVVKGTLKRMAMPYEVAQERLGPEAKLEVCVVCSDGAVRCAMCADHICTKHLIEYTCDACRRRPLDFPPAPKALA